MTCKNCGVENPENAVFCGACGTRLDGKKPCPSCGGLNEENSSFCVFCGKKIDSETVPAVTIQTDDSQKNISRFLLTFFLGWIGSIVINHSSLKRRGYTSRTLSYVFLSILTLGIYGLVASIFNLMFDPAKEYNIGYFPDEDNSINREMEETTEDNSVNGEIAATAVPMYEAKPVSREKKNQWDTVSFWSDKIQSIALFIGACFALLFVFFIGGAFNYAEDTGSDVGGLTPAKNLYYFFGDVYKDISGANVGSNFFNGLNKTALYGFAVVGTIAMAATLICTLVFAIRAVYAFVLNVQKKSDKRPDQYAFGAIMSFLLGALIFSLLNITGAEVKVMGISVENYYGLNTATEWGIALSLLGLFVASVCAIAKKGKAVLARDTLKKVGVFALVVLVGAIAFGLTQISAVVATVEEGSYEMSMEVGFSKMASAMISSVSSRMYGLSETLRNEVETNLAIGTISYTLATVLSVGVLLCIGLSLYKKIRSVYVEELQSGSKLAVVGAVLALLVLIATIVGNSCMEEVGEIIDKSIGSSEQFTFGLGNVITVFIFSILNAVGSIFIKVFDSRKTA